MSKPDRTLRLSARIESRSTRHAFIGVFQNGGKAGVLCVDADYAEEILGLLNTVTKAIPIVNPDAKEKRDAEQTDHTATPKQG